jgi:hypothetical protein
MAACLALFCSVGHRGGTSWTDNPHSMLVSRLVALSEGRRPSLLQLGRPWPERREPRVTNVREDSPRRISFSLAFQVPGVAEMTCINISAVNNQSNQPATHTHNTDLTSHRNRDAFQITSKEKNGDKTTVATTISRSPLHLVLVIMVLWSPV